MKTLFLLSLVFLAASCAGPSAVSHSSAPPAAEQAATRKPEFYVRGNVLHEGQYPLRAGLGVIAGLVMAGGVTPESGGPFVIVYRNQQSNKVHVFEILDGKAADFRLLPGDAIVVPYQHCYGGLSAEEIATLNARMKKYAAHPEGAR